MTTTDKADSVRVEIYVATGFANATHREYIKVPRGEWNAMTPKERREYLDDWALTEMQNRVDWGWSIEDPDDHADTED